MSPDRLPCVVPGCRCTAAKEEPEDDCCLCRKHWPLCRRDRRRAYRRRHKSYLADLRRLRPRWEAQGTQAIPDDEWLVCWRKGEAMRRLWRALVREATDKAMGIG